MAARRPSSGRVQRPPHAPPLCSDSTSSTPRRGSKSARGPGTATCRSRPPNHKGPTAGAGGGLQTHCSPRAGLGPCLESRWSHGGNNQAPRVVCWCRPRGMSRAGRRGRPPRREPQWGQAEPGLQGAGLARSPVPLQPRPRSALGTGDEGILQDELCGRRGSVPKPPWPLGLVPLLLLPTPPSCPLLASVLASAGEGSAPTGPALSLLTTQASWGIPGPSGRPPVPPVTLPAC